MMEAFCEFSGTNPSRKAQLWSSVGLRRFSFWLRPLVVATKRKRLPFRA
jgi:hypothetical protein